MSDHIIQESVRLFAEQRQIRSLYHFTRMENVSSILEHGLLSRNDFEKHVVTPMINDHERLDRRTGFVSVSISFPNHSMFFSCRDRQDGAWVVLEIDPSVLWKQHCLFCKHNAADHRVRDLEDASLDKVTALAGMYEDDPSSRPRSSLGIRDCDPTDVQAEVLVKGRIGAEDIRRVIVEEGAHAAKLAACYPSIDIPVVVDETLFSMRGFKGRYPGSGPAQKQPCHLV